MKIHSFGIISTIGMSILLLTACKKNQCSDSVKGTFKDATGIGGCGIVIELSDGKYLEPKNLSEINIDAEDGKTIWFSYHLIETGGTNCMMGKMIEIDCITER